MSQDPLKIGGNPFAGFKDFATCERWVKKNRPKVKDAAAYCATIMRKVEGELKDIVKRPISVGTLQKHKIGKEVHVDLKLRWYNKKLGGLTDFVRNFTLTKVPQDLPNVKLTEEILASSEACPKVFSWEKINGFPTLFTLRSKENMPFKEVYSDPTGFLKLPTKFKTVLD